MAMQRVFSWTSLFLVLLYSMQTLQLPLEESEKAPSLSRQDETEQARVMWNNFKRFQRRSGPLNARRPRARRDTGPEPTIISESELESLERDGAPQYLLNIYRNLTTAKVQTEANTIRSLKVIQTSDPVCGWYNFSLELVDPREFILLVELVLHINHQPIDSHSDGSYYVVINRHRHGHDPKLMTRQTVSARHRGLVKFDILSSTREWLEGRESHPHKKLSLQALVYTDFTAYKENQNPLSCSTGALQFYYEKDTPQEPLLAIDSFDGEVEKIDYSVLTASLPTRRRSVSKRQSTRPQNCHVHELIVRSNDLNQPPSLIKDQTVRVPPDYNAGICGGVCEHVLPLKPSPIHATLLHVLLSRDDFDDNGYSIQQCCAPVAYSALDIISTSNSNQVVQITRLTNMRIVDCDCIDVVVYS